MRPAVPRSVTRAVDSDPAALDLLDELITTPLASEAPPLPAAVLRSTEEQRQIALKPFLLRTWLDHALQQVEWLLVLTTVLFFSYWVIDGYGRDWWHAQQQAVQAPVAQARAVQPQAAPHKQQAAKPAMPESDLLPYSSDEPQRAPALDDYMVPGQEVAAAPLGDPQPRRLIIPAMGLDTPVVEVTVVDGAWQVADYAAGYHHGSAYPGDVGNTVLAGHAGVRGAVFHNLGDLRAGDPITVETGNWRYGYRVRELTKVLPNQVEVMAPTATPVLTLITCTSWDTQRLIVVADLVEARPIGAG